ncbi:MAG: hypothetical protein RLZZ290_1171 [Pseudomonadota bacterium]|jgi:pimeloyl-ACP methyl ester carboxylesterase
MSVPLILVPGTLCDARVFRRVSPKLKTEVPIRHLSLRGLSKRRAWVHGLLRTLPDRFVIAGFSLGGLVALEILRQVPERVAGLALISSNAEAASTRHRMNRRRLNDELRSHGLRHLCGRLKQRYFLNPRDAIRYRSTLVQMAELTPLRHAHNQFDFAAKRQDGHASLRAFRRPLLILSGRSDTICPPSLQIKAAQSSPQSCLELLPRCGHFSLLERPGRVAHSLLNWIREAKSEIENVYT